MKTLLLIDGHAMIHRAFHALPPLRNKNGVLTNAVYGFFMMLHKTVIDFQPTHLVVCFDTPKPTFRKELFEGYQAKRPPMDDGLRPQFGMIKELLDKAHVARLEKEGFEADDVIGTLATRYKNDFDRILILTGDKDILQLVDEKISVITPITGLSTIKLYTPDDVKVKMGVEPLKIPDYKALAGDPSDNYQTAKGIGPKTAVGLIEKFQTIENLLANLNQVEKERIRGILEEYKETIILFKQIATIVKNVDVEMSFDQTQFNGFSQEMLPALHELQLFTVAQKLLNAARPAKAESLKVEPPKQNPTDQLDLF